MITAQSAGIWEDRSHETQETRIHVGARRCGALAGGELIANGRIPIQAIIAAVEADAELEAEGA